MALANRQPVPGPSIHRGCCGKGKSLSCLSGKDIHAFLSRIMTALDQGRFRTELNASRSHFLLTFGPQSRLPDQPGCLQKVRRNQSDFRKKKMVQ